jgi:hypothetical protein
MWYLEGYTLGWCLCITGRTVVWLEVYMAVTSLGCCHLRCNNDIVNWVV